MERFHRERKERAISIYKQDCEDALRGLLKGMKPHDITAILKAIRERGKRRKWGKKKRKLKVIIPKKEEGGYSQNEDDEKEPVEEVEEVEEGTDDSDDEDDVSDDDNNADVNVDVNTDNNNEIQDKPQEVDLSYLLGTFESEPYAQVKEPPLKKPATLKRKVVSTARRSSLFDNTSSFGNKIKSRVERMTKAMKKMLAKIVFNINVSNIDGDLVEEDARLLKKAQEEADRVRKLHAYRLHLIPKSSPATSIDQAQPTIGGKLWGDDLTEQLLAKRFVNDDDGDNSAFISTEPTLVLGAQLLEQSVSAFSSSLNDDLDDDDGQFMSSSQMSIIGEIINEPKVVITRTYDPMRIRLSTIQNIVNKWIQYSRDKVASMIVPKDNSSELSSKSKELSNNNEKLSGRSCDESFLGISSVVVSNANSKFNGSTISKLTSESFASESIGDDNTAMGSTFWTSYEEFNKKKLIRTPVESRSQSAYSNDGKKNIRKENNLVTGHNPDISNLIVLATSTVTNKNDGVAIKASIDIPPFTPVVIAQTDKVLFPRTVKSIIDDSNGKKEGIAIENNTIKKSSIISTNSTEWLPLESVCVTGKIDDISLDNNSIFDIPKYIDKEGLVPPDTHPFEIPQTIDDLMKRPVEITNSSINKKAKTAAEKATSGTKKKSIIFSGIHSLARNSYSTSNSTGVSGLDYGVMGLSIPLPYDKNHYSYYDSHDTYDDEYKQYLEEEDKLSGVEIGLIISHYDTNLTKAGLQRQILYEEPDEAVRKLQKLMADCFHDNLPFVVGKRFQPTLEDIYERSESEIEFGLGLESSILDVISTSCYKENDKDFTNESITTIDDSISVLTAANVSNSTYNYYEESEFSSLLLIDKIQLGSSSPIASNPKRPSNYKRSYNFIRKNIKDNTNTESDNIEIPRFSVSIVPTDSINTDDISDNKVVNVPSVYLNKYLKKGILEESRKVAIIRDIAPTIGSRYLESKRKLISRECKDDNNEMISNDVVSERQIKSRGNKSPSIAGRLRSESHSNNTTEIDETNMTSTLNYSPPRSPPADTSNKFSDIFAVGINNTSPTNKNKGENQE